MKRLNVSIICGIALLLTGCAATCKAQDYLLRINQDGRIEHVPIRQPVAARLLPDLTIRQDGPQTLTENPIQLVEKLADGSFIVRIGGVDFRAFSPDKVTEFQERKIRGEACDKALALSDKENDLLKQQNSVQSGQINTLTTLAEFLAKNGGGKKDSVLRQLGELAWPILVGVLSKR
jgi:hypothetical protein